MLPAHTDKYDVLVLQLWGRKAWRTCVPRLAGDAVADGARDGTLSVVAEPPTVAAGPRLSEAERSELHEVLQDRADGCTAYVEDAIERAGGDLECTARSLEAGDVLYLPKGVVHAARTDATAPAAHLTISLPMKGKTWGDLLTFATDTAIADGLPALQAPPAPPAAAAAAPQEGAWECAARLAVANTLANLARQPPGIGWRRPLPMWLLQPWADAGGEEGAGGVHVTVNTHTALLELWRSTGGAVHLTEELPHALTKCAAPASDAVPLAAGLAHLIDAATAAAPFASRLLAFLRSATARNGSGGGCRGANLLEADAALDAPAGGRHDMRGGLPEGISEEFALAIGLHDVHHARGRGLSTSTVSCPDACAALGCAHYECSEVDESCDETYACSCDSTYACGCDTTYGCSCDSVSNNCGGWCGCGLCCNTCGDNNCDSTCGDNNCDSTCGDNTCDETLYSCTCLPAPPPPPSPSPPPPSPSLV